MRLVLHGTQYAVIRLKPDTSVPAWANGASFLSITRTANELSIICPEEQVPQTSIAARGWALLEVEGPLELAASGILHTLLTPLTNYGLSVLTIATHDTDYLLVRDVERACSALRHAGIEVITSGD